MATNLSNSIEEIFRTLEDPRRETENKRHNFLDILVISICACICGANDFVAIERFGLAKREWFGSFLELPNGIPSHDTFNHVFAKLSPQRFGECFMAWVSKIADLFPGQVIAVDGKTLRRSHDRGQDKAAIHMVSAWAQSNSLVLGQIKTEEKSNEITAIPELLNALALQGCLVTIDAMGCQKKIVETIIEGGADYLIAVKENQPKLHASIISHFQQVEQKQEEQTLDFAQTFEISRDREEQRRCWVSHEVEHLENREQWKKLNSVVKIVSERTIDGKTSLEDRYYISSSSKDSEYLLQATRAHWSIENSLHWVLDIAFREDESRIRKGFAPQNVATLRHIAVNLLKQEKTAKIGIQNKRLSAGWDSQYLARVLAGIKT